MVKSLRRKMTLRRQEADAAAVRSTVAGLSRAGQVSRSTVPVEDADIPVVETLEQAVDTAEALPGVVETADQAGSDAYEAWDQSEFAKSLALQLETDLGEAQAELSQALADAAAALAEAGLARSEAATALADAADAVSAAGVATGQATQAIADALAASGLAADAQSTASDAEAAAVSAASVAALASTAAATAQGAADQAAADAVSLSAAAEVAAKAYADAEAEAARLAAIAAASGDATAKADAARAAAELAAAADAKTKADAAEAAAKVDAAAAQSTANQAVSDAATAAGQAAAALSAAQAAQSSANTAQTTADGKNKTTRSVSDASGSGVTVGDRWEKYDTLAAGGKLLAAWAWDGAAWRSVSFAATYLPQVDIGSGTFGSLAGSRLVASSVTTDELNALAVTAAKLAADSVIAVKIAANAVTAAKIEANAVIAEKIAAGAVTTVKLDALAVTAEKIAALAITADKIAAKAITTAELAADAIDGMTITGALIRTAVVGQRLQLDVDGLKAFNAAGAQVADITSADGGLRIGVGGVGGGDFSVASSDGGVSATAGHDGLNVSMRAASEWRAGIDITWGATEYLFLGASTVGGSPNALDLTSVVPLRVNTRMTTPGNTFALKSQLNAWAPIDGTHAWVTSEGREYVRRGGAWRRVPITLSGTVTAGTTAVEVFFPSGFFPEPPVVTASVSSSAGPSTAVWAHVFPPTESSVRFRLSSGTNSYPIGWQAVLN